METMSINVIRIKTYFESGQWAFSCCEAVFFPFDVHYFRCNPEVRRCEYEGKKWYDDNEKHDGWLWSEDWILRWYPIGRSIPLPFPMDRPLSVSLWWGERMSDHTLRPYGWERLSLETRRKMRERWERKCTTITYEYALWQQKFHPQINSFHSFLLFHK